MEIFNHHYHDSSIRVTLDEKTSNRKLHGKYRKTFTRVTFIKHGKETSWIVLDKDLVRHMGLPMYLGFHHLSVSEQHTKKSVSKVKSTDFDEYLLFQPIDPNQLDQAIDQIFQCRSCQHLDAWREVKATLAAAIVIINNFDWYLHQSESCCITRNARNITEYLDHALRFIIKHSTKMSFFAQDMLNKLEHQKCFFPDDLKIRICLGVDIISTAEDRCDLCKALTDDSEWWEWALLTLIGVIILIVILWIALRLVVYPPTKVYPTEGIRV